jgi:hypothetical protein
MTAEERSRTCGQNGTQFAAFYYDLRLDRVVRTNGISIKLCAEEWLFAALCGYPEVSEWCIKHGIQLLAGTHWLIYDYRYRRSFVADPRTAMKCLDNPYEFRFVYS